MIDPKSKKTKQFTEKKKKKKNKTKIAEQYYQKIMLLVLHGS